MPTTYDILSPFTRLQPGPFISRYQDWILFTLLLFFFWAVVGIALKKKFGESRHLRVLVTSVALMLSVGSYYSIYRGWLHIGLQGLGMFGAILLFVIIFLIIFELMKMYGMHLSNALPFGFALFYISLWAVSPNILDTIQKTFPPANGILLILFIASAFKIITAFFRYSKKSPLVTARNLMDIDFTSDDSRETSKEISEDKNEIKFLKKKTIKLEGTDLKTLEDIENSLKEMIRLILKKGNDLDGKEIAELTRALRRITKNEDILKKGIELIREHLYAFKSIHQRDIPQLEKRLAETKDAKKRKVIEEELRYQRQMIKILDFMKGYEYRVYEFTKSFSNLMYNAIQRLKSNSPKDVLLFLEDAQKGIQKIKRHYLKQKSYEKYLLKLDKKTTPNLKKEKDQK